jgi:AraC-like DNA-binding protein
MIKKKYILEYRNFTTLIDAQRDAFIDSLGVPLIDDKLSLQYIDRNYKEDIKLEDISKAVGLTPVYLHKLFLKTTGQTPHQLLLKKRLTMAKELLAGSDLSLVNVAAETGFSSQSYFNAVFKKHCGVTPLTFRQDAFNKYQL